MEYNLTFLEAVKELCAKRCEWISDAFGRYWKVSEEGDMLIDEFSEIAIPFKKIFNGWRLVKPELKTEKRIATWWIVINHDGTSCGYNNQPSSEIYQSAKQIIAYSHPYTHTYKEN